MAQQIQVGTRVRQASGNTGVVKAIGDRITIWWDRGSGNTLSYTPADVAERFAVVQSTPAAVVAQAPSRGYARRSKCPNPRDCGDPTCSGDCGY